MLHVSCSTISYIIHTSQIRRRRRVSSTLALILTAVVSSWSHLDLVVSISSCTISSCDLAPSSLRLVDFFKVKVHASIARPQFFVFIRCNSFHFKIKIKTNEASHPPANQNNWHFGMAEQWPRSTLLLPAFSSRAWTAFSQAARLHIRHRPTASASSQITPSSISAISI